MTFSKEYTDALASGHRQTGDGKVIVAAFDEATQTTIHERVYPCEVVTWLNTHNAPPTFWSWNSKDIETHYHGDKP